MTIHSNFATPISSRVGRVFLLVALAAVFVFGGCSKKADTRPRFHLEGKVVSVDLHDGTATIDHKDIPGFMDAMTMPYAAENPRELEKLSPGDQITANIVEDQGVPLLENIVVKQKAPPSGAPKP